VLALAVATLVTPAAAQSGRIVPPAAAAPAQGDEPPGLVARWRGEGDATDSAGRNDGTWVGTASYGPGPCGQAFVFDGASYVEMGTVGLPTGASDRTLALWVKIDPPAAGHAFFAGYGGFGAMNRAFNIGADEGNMVDFSQYGEGMSGPRLRAGVWYHVAVTDEGGRQRLYLNGTLVGTRSLTVDSPDDARFFIGKTDGEHGDTRSLRGSLDEVSVYARALAAEEIGAMFKAGFGGSAERVAAALTAEDRTVAEASQLLNDGDDLAGQGRYREAIPPLERAAALFEESLGTRSHRLRYTLTVLGRALDRAGEYERAWEPLQRALAMSEPGSEVALVLDNMLARLSVRMGRYADAEARLERSIATYGDHVHSIVSLADICAVEGDDAKAESLYLRALALGDDACHGCWGPGHPGVPFVLNSLAMLYCRRGDYETAEQMALRSLGTYENAPTSPDASGALGALGTIYKARGEYEKAEAAYRRGLALVENALGPGHPDVAVFLTYLAEVAWARGDAREALPLLRRAEEIRERNIALNLAAGSDGQKLDYLAQYARDVDRLIAFNARGRPDDPDAARLALTAVLRRKARGLDAVAGSLATLRRHASPDDRALLDELEQARARLAALVLRGAVDLSAEDYRAEIGRLEQRTEALEATISARSAEFRARSAPVTVEAVQAAMPADTALVEFVRYAPRDPRTVAAWGAPRYAAYVLGREGDPRWVDLGDAPRVDASVGRFRAAVCDPRRRDVKALGRALDELVMRPVRELLRGETNLLISPDGALNLVPFAALVDEQDRYLAERCEVTNLTSGRDLLRLRERVDSRAEPLIVADPDFDAASATATVPQNPELSRGIDLARPRFLPLSGANEEARLLGRLIPGSVVLTRDRATKAALQQARAPAILHVATHGFFLDDVRPGAEAERRIELVRSGALRPALAGLGARIENPLLRSGLALAGANRPNSGVRDGVLTALEAAGLDLWGTELVVLSACDTGVGEVRNGEGVFGLRRALVLAGAETQVMSLWDVGDAATRELMVAYYAALLEGKGRGEAMRGVQLKMMAEPRRRHPAFWAGFIVSGDWRPLRT
jgi:CHAT domain-containing protein/Tfp pilus assembly protein PilF